MEKTSLRYEGLGQLLGEIQQHSQTQTGEASIFHVFTDKRELFDELDEYLTTLEKDIQEGASDSQEIAKKIETIFGPKGINIDHYTSDQGNIKLLNYYPKEFENLINTLSLTKKDLTKMLEATHL